MTSSHGPVQTEAAACALCRVPDQSVLYTGLTVADLNVEFGLVQCNRCGLVYLSPRPTTEAIGRFYGKEYFGGRESERRRRGLRASADDRRSRSKIDIVRTHCPTPGLALDVGVGSGGFLTDLAGLGWTVEGSDCYTEAADRTIERFRQAIPLHLGPLETLRLSASHFDLVTMWDSLEHMHQPFEALLAARRVLRPEGVLIVSLPNFASLEARWMGARWPHLDVPRHLYHFSSDSLDRMLAEAGFSRRKMTTSYRLLAEHMVRWIAPWRASFDSVAAPASYAVAALDIVLDLALAPIRMIAQGRGQGCALVAIARH